MGENMVKSLATEVAEIVGAIITLILGGIIIWKLLEVFAQIK